MAKRKQLHWHDTGFVTLFARAPQLCAAALAGLGSALWLNVVGPFAGLVAAWGALILVNALAIAVVAILAILVTTAGTLLAADWQADVASRQAWAEIDVAAAELRLRPESVALSQVDPRYLTATTSEALPSIIRAHRSASPAPVVEASAEASSVTRMVAASGESIPASLAPDAASRISPKISKAPASDVAVAHSPCRSAASTSPGQQLIVVASCRARPQVFRAETAASAARIVANGGVWSERLQYHRCILTRTPPDRHIADIVVLSGDRSNRDACERFPCPSTGDGTVKSDKPPSCRGPPSTAGHGSRPIETVPVERSAKDACEVPAAAALQPDDPIVRDNLGHHVPVCAAELDVIETYLDQILRDLLASSTAGSGQKEA